MQVVLPQETIETWNISRKEYKPVIAPTARYVVLEGKDKAVLHQEILTNGQLSLLDPADDFRDQISMDTQMLVRSHREFQYKMQRVDFRFYFAGLTKWALNKTHECIFIKGNMAWIKQDEQGIYRYYSKDQDRGTIFGLNIFDLIEIREDVYSFTNARRTLAHDLGASYRERDWEYEQERKYRRHIKLLRDREGLNAEAPNVFKLIRKYSQILVYLNEWGLSHIWDSIMSTRGESIFFNSTTHMQQDLKKDQTICSRAVNMFAILGLIEKIPPSEVPQKLLSIASALRPRNSPYRLLNFYSIPPFDLRTAELRAITMFENGITSMSLISERKVEQVFGAEFSKMIYVNPTVAEQLDYNIVNSVIDDSSDLFFSENE